VAEELSQRDGPSSRVELRHELLDAIVECQSPALGKSENRRCCELLRDRADLEHVPRSCGRRVLLVGHAEGLGVNDLPALGDRDLHRRDTCLQRGVGALACCCHDGGGREDRLRRLHRTSSRGCNER
jgi:hypothetical protein